MPERSALEKHLDRHYQPSDYNRVLRAAQQGETRGGMNPNCRVAVNIPAYYNEPRLGKTLAKYFNQASGQFPHCAFEVDVLVNGPEGVDLAASPAYFAAIAEQRLHPKHNVNVFTLNYAPEDQLIGKIRGDLASMTLVRAVNSGIDLTGFALVTNDADLIGLPNDYLRRIDARFRADQSIDGISGPVLYPRAGLSSDDLVLATQRFHDFLEIIKRHRTGYIRMRGGNSAFRASRYIEAGGHRKLRIAENRPLAESMTDKRPGSVVYDRGTYIYTSPRRQLFATANEQLVSTRYKAFSRKGDLAEEFRKPIDDVVFPEKRHSVTNPGFPTMLAHEISSVFEHDITSIVMKDRRKAKSAAVTERKLARLTPAELYAEAVDRSPEAVAELIEEFRLAAYFLGVQLAFRNDEIGITRYSPLKRGVLERYRGI